MLGNLGKVNLLSGEDDGDIASPFLAWRHESIRMICGMASFSEANCDDEGEWGPTPPATYLAGAGLLKASAQGAF